MIGEGGGRESEERERRGKEEGRAGMKRYSVFTVERFLHVLWPEISHDTCIINLSLSLSTCRHVLLMCVVQGLWRSWSPIANGNVSAVTRHL